MVHKYLIVLAVTIILAILPCPPSEILSWLFASTASLTYIYFLYGFSRIRERGLIIAIECLAMSSALIAFCQRYFPNHIKQYLASESQWFWVNYEHIMGYCFLMEIVVIITGIANSAEFRRILFVCITRTFGDKRNNRHFLYSERVICTATQKIFRPH